MVEIDIYENEDLPNLFILFREWDVSAFFDYSVFESSLVKLLTENNTIVTAKENGLLIGYAQIRKLCDLGFEPYYEVVQLLVSEKIRCKGIGKLIMGKIDKIATSEGVGIIKLSSQVFRSKSHVFYENLGFEMSKISKFYERKTDNFSKRK
jgi:GNAT superfamily N-acetyltransferase